MLRDKSHAIALTVEEVSNVTMYDFIVEDKAELHDGSWPSVVITTGSSAITAISTNPVNLLTAGKILGLSTT